MQIGEKVYEQIVLTDESGCVLAIISDTEIIEKDGCRIELN